MTDRVYVLSDTANAEIEASKRRSRELVARHLATAEQASRLHWDTVKKIVNDGGHQESHHERIIFVQCRFCDKAERIQGDILRYTCTCSPHTTQLTFQNRTIAL